MFEVQLIKVRPLDELTGWDVFELMSNCQHIAGDYWLFEGDEEALEITGGTEVIGKAVTEGTGDMSSSELFYHCIEIFGPGHLDGQPAAWTMLGTRQNESFFGKLKSELG